MPSLDHTALPFRMAFASLRGMNRALAEALLARIGSEEDFFSMSERTLAAVMGFNNRIFADDYRRQHLEKARTECDFVAAHNIRVLYFTEPDYPVRLADCDDAPLMLFGAGGCSLNTGYFLSVVGTRHATNYGIDFVDRLISDLASSVSEPVTIVSGLAFGIDIAAHRAAMKHGLPTVAVLAHGLNTIYPAQHRNYAADIVHKDGMLITEYRSSDPIHKGNFVARNRIVAGICDCLVVAESARKGGALITAEIASGYHRDVFALPGRTSDRYSTGCNHLIASNVAALVTGADDIIEAMNMPSRTGASPAQGVLPLDLSAEEVAVIEFLTAHGEAQINRLSVELNQSVAKLLSILIEMEFKHLIITCPGGIYRLA